jgi:hypothetical protein
MIFFAEFLDDPDAHELRDIVIINERYSEPLQTGSFFRSPDTQRRNIFTDRKAKTPNFW